MLLYIVLPLLCVWVLAHSYLLSVGHYPETLVPLQLLMWSGGVWMLVDSVRHWETPGIIAGFVIIVVAGIAWVPLTISAMRQNRRTYCWLFSMFVQWSGCIVLNVMFCVLEAAVSACVSGACTVLLGVYIYRMWYSVEDNAYIQLE